MARVGQQEHGGIYRISKNTLSDGYKLRGDLGLGQVKKYDIELWVPNENKYREISSASYFHDFQTRRLNIRYKDESGRLKFAHSLNSTAVPTPRVIVSIAENYQQSDGSILVPKF